MNRSANKDPQKKKGNIRITDQKPKCASAHKDSIRAKELGPAKPVLSARDKDVHHILGHTFWRGDDLKADTGEDMENGVLVVILNSFWKHKATHWPTNILCQRNGTIQ